MYNTTSALDGTLWVEALRYYGLGEYLAHYRTPRHLATTTAAEVWRVYTENRSSVVIKIGRRGYEWTVESEWKWLDLLLGAENVVQIKSHALDGRFLIEEHVEGLCLDELSIGSGDLRTSLIAEILLQLQSGLDAIHQVVGGVRPEDRRGNTSKLRGYLFEAGRIAREHIAEAMLLVRPLDEPSEFSDGYDSELCEYLDKETCVEQRGGPPIFSNGDPPMLVGLA